MALSSNYNYNQGEGGIVFIITGGPYINDVMLEGGREGVRVRMTNNVEGCIKKHAKGQGRGGRGLKMSQNSMTSFMGDPKLLIVVNSGNEML